MRKERQAFSREFKVEAVQLLEEGKKPAAEVARELGVVQRFLKENVLILLNKLAEAHGNRTHLGRF